MLLGVNLERSEGLSMTDAWDFSSPTGGPKAHANSEAAAAARRTEVKECAAPSKPS
jgi:hypothetical protein